jgi:hypothetical protein
VLLQKREREPKREAASPLWRSSLSLLLLSAVFCFFLFCFFLLRDAADLVLLQNRERGRGVVHGGKQPQN